MKVLLLSVLLVLGGCASLTATEESQLAYQGQGSNPCLFGGVSPAADQHCQEQSRGLYGVLLSLNTVVLQDLAREGLGRASCQQHVARVRDALWERPDLEVRSVFSCPPGSEDCHVSALVIARSGEAYVLDNGTLFPPKRVPGAIGRFGEFMEAVNGEFWFHPPAGQSVIVMAPPAPAAAVTATASPSSPPRSGPPRR